MHDFAVYEKVDYRFELTEAALHEALFAPHPLLGSVLANDGEVTVGFALWLVFFGTMSGRCGMFVDNVFVAEPYRKRGIAKAMFRHMARIAVEQQYVVMQWDVNRMNAPAIEFYRRIGAQPVTTDMFMEELRGDALRALAK
jgi:GNAT superfamily N-acetyltransferase